MIKLSNKQKQNLAEVYKIHCRHAIQSENGEFAVCWLKKTQERCEYSTWTTWADCPQDCPHHLFMTKIWCDPLKCSGAKAFTKTVEAILNE